MVKGVGRIGVRPCSSREALLFWESDLEKLFFERQGRGFGAVGDAEAFEDRGHLLLDGDFGKAELLGDVGV